ncbi:MAG TPA: DUF4349 domain-containing protein [Puia sp.]|uniref:DUF4349 domain-containing protein n=1 Tax=Puia sp. TaxID=2045100 RepID=UPI002CAEFBCA|nr:DUF4349 domain-containing protein [Puia sp.]HVU96186.1 DUF4349 domain-containing protein [Puia sp.]
MTRIVYAAPAVLLISLCLGCDNAAKSKPNADAGNVELAKAPAGNAAIVVDSAARLGDGLVADNEFESPTHSPGGQPQPRKPAPPTVPNPDWDKKIIKTADLSLEVKNYGAFTRRLHEVVKETGGYIAQEEQTQSPAEITNTLTIKVPVASFDDLLLQIPGDSDRLMDKRISSQDVTMEVVDTKSRLETKKEVRERYLELLRQAHSMKDILAVQNEINDIQQDMDQASGRIAWLGHSAAYSTVNLKFYQVLAPGAPTDNSPGFFHRLTDALGDGWQGFSAFLIALFRLWPLLLGAGAFVYCMRKFVRPARIRPAAVRSQDEVTE